MARLKGLKQLQEALDNLKAVAEEVRENLDEKREWLDNKSDRWQEGGVGLEWNDHLDEVESALDEIENLELPSA